jgi:hypothetical protein
LRYRLYDIDIIINRTLVYGSLTLMLALVYFGGVTVTQALFQTLTCQQKQPQLVVVASTLLIAALFTPLRRHIQSFIDRRFYRRKYDTAKTLEAFSAKLRNDTDLDALSNDLVGVVRRRCNLPTSRCGCAQMQRRRVKALANRLRDLVTRGHKGTLVRAQCTIKDSMKLSRLVRGDNVSSISRCPGKGLNKTHATLS